MTDEKMPDVIGLQFFTIDGFRDFHMVNGVLRMTAIRLSSSGDIIPLFGADVMESARTQLRERILAAANAETVTELGSKRAH